MLIRITFEYACGGKNDKSTGSSFYLKKSFQLLSTKANKKSMGNE